MFDSASFREPHGSQEDLYDRFGAGLLQHFALGLNTCVFAYGQTGSGKTHTVRR